MPLTTEQAALLKPIVTAPPYADKTDEECRSLLNMPAVIEGGTVTRPKPFSRQEVLACLSTATLGGIMTLAIAPKIIDAINNSDHQALGEYAGAMAANSRMQPAEYAAVSAVLARTESISLPDSFGPSPFQSIAGVGDVPLPMQDGTTSEGTCYAWMVTQARAS